MAFSNQCGRLIVNVIIAYNSTLPWTLLERNRSAGNRKAILLLHKILQSPGGTSTSSGATCSATAASQSA